MIDSELAKQLKAAGLPWQPAKRDDFMIPGGLLEHEVFTLNDLTILVQMVKGQATVMFHGSAEWALDDVLLADVVWLPSETQLREAIQLRLGGDDAALTLGWTLQGYRCELRHLGQNYSFAADTAARAYGAALLFLLEHQRQARGSR